MAYFQSKDFLKNIFMMKSVNFGSLNTAINYTDNSQSTALSMDLVSDKEYYENALIKLMNHHMSYTIV
jgi:hypothetical protein